MIRLPRPEGGEEHGVVFERNHGCKEAAHFRAALNDPDVDSVVFPVGQAGWMMPLGIPFEVESVEPCSVCGVLLRIWVEWIGPKVFSSGLWTPGMAA